MDVQTELRPQPSAGDPPADGPAFAKASVPVELRRMVGTGFAFGIGFCLANLVFVFGAVLLILLFDAGMFAVLLGQAQGGY